MNRQTALFSDHAQADSKIAEKHLSDPVKITIKVKAENSPNIHQKFIKVKSAKKDMMLRLLEIEKIDAILVFARTKKFDHGDCRNIARKRISS